MIFPKVISVAAADKYKIRIKFNDGTEGTTDLSDMAGKGVFKAWDAGNTFSKVYINEESGAITWPGNIDIDILNCYLQIKDITYEQFRLLRQKQTHAVR
jgi:hypothetical protein